MSSKIRLKRGKTASWADNSKDNVLAYREIGFEVENSSNTDTNVSDPRYIKVSNKDGYYAWNSIPYPSDWHYDNLILNNASVHNSIYRGKDLSQMSIDTICNRISAGTFEDLYVGDYYSMSISYNGTFESVTWVIAGFDYYYNTGSPTRMTTHHAVIVPLEPFKTAESMNASATTSGGYAGSNMHTTILPKYIADIKTRFGASHVIPWYDWLTTDVDNNAMSDNRTGKGRASGGSWQTIEIRLMNEPMLTGTKVMSSSSFDTVFPNMQLPLFKCRPDLITSDRNYHLSNVVSSSAFGGVWENHLSWFMASSKYYVRPIWLLG